MVGSAYVSRVIDFDAQASAIMRDLGRKTFSFRDDIDVIGGLNVVRPTKNLVIHSITADPNIADISDYAESLIERLVYQATEIGAVPVAMTNIIERSVSDLDLISQVADAFLRASRKYNIAIVSGENAFHGKRVRTPLNLSGTMISYADGDIREGTFGHKDSAYILIKSDGSPVLANSDGEGTKVSIKERTELFQLQDLMAMLADDVAKNPATIKAISAILEMSNQYVPSGLLWRSGKKNSDYVNAYFTLQLELTNRISGYGPSPYNVGGTAISFIDEKSIKEIPTPKEGEYLVAVRNKDIPYTFRCNGIGALIEGLENIYGEQWHEAVFEGKPVGEWAGAPSTVFYPVAKALFSDYLISGFFHMSGGAYKEKLAEPLSKHHLHAELRNLFEPSPFMKMIIDSQEIPASEAYRIWNMGNEAFVSTSSPEAVIERLASFGLEGRIASQPLKRGTGITINAYNGEQVRF